MANWWQRPNSKPCKYPNNPLIINTLHTELNRKESPPMSIDSSAKIHPNAVIEDGARIAKNCAIGPFCVVGAGVQLGENTVLKSHVVITGNTQIGKDCTIYPFASIGHAPQDLKYKGEDNSLIIGDKNRIREHVTISPGTAAGGGITRIGNDNLLMVGCHIGHDCQIGNRIVFANNAIFGGHCVIEDEVIIGGQSAVHQFCRIGKGAIIGGFTGVDADILPYSMAVGERAHLQGLNLIGLKRRGVNNADIRQMMGALDGIFWGNFSVKDNVQNEKNRVETKDNTMVQEMLDFILADSKRPLTIPKSRD